MTLMLKSAKKAARLIFIDKVIQLLLQKQILILSSHVFGTLLYDCRTER